MKNLIATALLLLTTMLSAANAASLPAHYPKEFQYAGNVDGLDLSSRQIVIGDMSFYLSEQVTLHSRSKKSDSLGRLRQNIFIGIRFRSNQRVRIIDEIWLLPSNYKRPIH